MSMKVDPDALRAWAKFLDGLSGEIGKLVDGVTAPVDGTDPFPGVDLAATVFAARDQVKGGLTFFAARPQEMAEIAKGVGDKYEVTDDDFATKLREMGGLK
ncbi:hypothetical protein [Nocardia africana]|uniref:Excreted virulence factor EspC, type VII ESX diderm n=1 Tax=Nocardia africana TaxID=134964 RepID=A0A378X2E1_9NOCA|nr:hypothetical protein [Nocardia africana]MCC3311550.1 hypothetical protein [Nocardia africana]SUA47187.1 Uncharacterised protein [Nocardia africana]